jgi:predicted RNase H-like HicB family nuclease
MFGVSRIPERFRACPAQRQDRAEILLRFQHAARAHLEGLLEIGRPLARLISPLAFAMGIW